MMCGQCGSVLSAPVLEDGVPFNCGIPDVFLSGVPVSRCGHCGHYEATVPNLERLHGALARLLAEQPHRLTPQQVRFMRKWKGWSGKDFAGIMGVTPETVSRWENGQKQMQRHTEAYFKWVVLTQAPMSAYEWKKNDEHCSARFQATLTGDDWRAVAAE